jgi:type IV secretion system protein VirB10
MSDVPAGPGIVSRRAARRRRMTIPAVAGGGLAVVLVGGAVWAYLGGGKATDQRLDVPRDPIQVTRIKPKPEPPLPTPASLLAAPAVMAPPLPSSVPLPSREIETRPAESGSLTTAYDDDAPRRAPVQETSAVAAAGPVRPAGMSTVGFKPLAMQGVEAGVITDLSHTIKPTTRALCTLDQAINGQHEGPLVCHLADPVYSWDLSEVLLPKGTPVIGTYSSLSVGQSRMLAMAANAFRSDGVVVPLGGDPFTDDLGRMGVPGHVDTRFWERFGNALIMDAALALINLPQAALTSRQPGTTNLNFNAGQSEGVLNQVLAGSVNLPPILTKNQGEQITILITQPIHIGEARFEVAR